MESELWDIKDKLPVTLPMIHDGIEGEALLAASKFRQDVEIDRYDRAVAKLTGAERGRLMRAMATIETIKNIMMHGVRSGLISIEGNN